MADSFPTERAGLLEASRQIHESGTKPLRTISPQLVVCLLKHIERSACITVCEDNIDWLVAFTSSTDAFEMRHALGLTERVDVIEIVAGNTSYTTFFLDGEQAVLQDQATRPQ